VKDDMVQGGTVKPQDDEATPMKAVIMKGGTVKGR
jgi:hypothetical protein